MFGLLISQAIKVIYSHRQNYKEIMNPPNFYGESLEDWKEKCNFTHGTLGNNTHESYVMSIEEKTEFYEEVRLQYPVLCFFLLIFMLLKEKPPEN